MIARAITFDHLGARAKGRLDKRLCSIIQLLKACQAQFTHRSPRRKYFYNHHFLTYVNFTDTNFSKRFLEIK